MVENLCVILNYSYRADLPEVQPQMSDRAINGSGIPETARVLKMSQTMALFLPRNSAILR